MRNIRSTSTPARRAMKRSETFCGEAARRTALPRKGPDSGGETMAIETRMAAVLLGVALGLAGQTGETYKARLNALPADARTRPELAGNGSVTAVLSGTKLTITGSFDSLRSA